MRKEQVLLILVVLLAAYCSTGYFEVQPLRVSYNPDPIEVEPSAFQEASLVDGDAAEMARRNFFTEPSETQPLPPRELEFPPRPPLSLCGMPLDSRPMSTLTSAGSAICAGRPSRALVGSSR